MAEEFVEEIQKRADVLWGCKRSLSALNRWEEWEHGYYWKSQAPMMEQIIAEWKETDPASAESLERFAKVVPVTLSDPQTTANLISKGVIPLLYRYMENYGGIDVTEGRWQLLSSASGYLTLRDTVTGVHLHSLDDPMWEAGEMAEQLFDPKNDTLVILGCGLGYFAYEMWRQSFEAIKVIVLEKDKNLVDYALAYGVLGRIASEALQIIVEPEEEKLLRTFNTIGEGQVVRYVPDYAAGMYSPKYAPIIAEYAENKKCLRRFRHYYEVNFRQNSLRFCGEFSDLVEKLREEKSLSDEMLVVAAGPSLNEQMEFLRERKGKCLILAVSTVLKKLYEAGILPDVVTVADPQEGLYGHIASLPDEAKTAPLLAESVANWQFLAHWNGPCYRVFACGFEKSEQTCREKNIEGWTNVGGTVSSMAIEAAVRLGAKRIHLIGLDLGYPGNRYYADGAVGRENNHMEGSITIPSVDGGTITTNAAFDLYRRIIERQIATYSKVEFLNRSKTGALIVGAGKPDEF